MKMEVEGYSRPVNFCHAKYRYIARDSKVHLQCVGRKTPHLRLKVISVVQIGPIPFTKDKLTKKLTKQQNE